MRTQSKKGYHYYLKKFLPHTLSGRTLTILITPMILVQLVIGIIFWDRYWTKMTEKLCDQLTAQVISLVDMAPHYPPYKMQLFSLKHFNIEMNMDDHLTEFHHPRQSQERWRERFLIASLKKKTSLPLYVKVSKNIVTIQLYDHHTLYEFKFSKRQLFSKSMPKILWWEIGAPIFFLLIAIIFMKNQIKPLEKLANYVEEVGKGRHPLPLRPVGAFEVRALIRSFNDMQDRIVRQINQRTEMLAGISHDLKTPLTRMELELAMMPPCETQTSLHQDVREMEQMVEQYLAFARGEEGEASIMTNMNLLMLGIVNQYKEHQINFNAKTDMVNNVIKPVSMKRALKNIIDNALRYGHHAWITINESRKYVIINIEDDGPGIDPTRYDDVFRPFMRLDESRNLATGGYGLGLAIVKDIITAHGGLINLSKSKYSGLNVTVKLPK